MLHNLFCWLTITHWKVNSMSPGFFAVLLTAISPAHCRCLFIFIEWMNQFGPLGIVSYSGVQEYGERWSWSWGQEDNSHPSAVGTFPERDTTSQKRPLSPAPLDLPTLQGACCQAQDCKLAHLWQRRASHPSSASTTPSSPQTWSGFLSQENHMWGWPRKQHRANVVIQQQNHLISLKLVFARAIEASLTESRSID